VSVLEPDPDPYVAFEPRRRDAARNRSDQRWPKKGDV
jgi:hypothetical protein